jgi:glyoxylase-like metal-dependent hydrolase (beta-lactamase superfamily II)
MKITNLTEDSKIYTSNVYLVLGTWNTLDDINTLIDTGSDESIVKKIQFHNTGLGKRKIDQVIITHSHSDHTALLPLIKETFHPKVYAFNSHLKGVDQVLKDGDFIRIGEQRFEVFHITSHSYDSICLYGETEGILFAGDTTFPIEFENERLKEENRNVLLRLKQKVVKTVYYGHGAAYDYTKREFLLIRGKEIV